MRVGDLRKGTRRSREKATMLCRWLYLALSALRNGSYRVSPANGVLARQPGRGTPVAADSSETEYSGGVFV